MRRLLFQSLINRPVTEAAPRLDEREVAALAREVDVAARGRLAAACRFAKWMLVRATDVSFEIHALNNAIYDLERFGIRFVASPRHADVLLVTGTADAQSPRRCYDPLRSR